MTGAPDLLRLRALAPDLPDRRSELEEVTERDHGRVETTGKEAASTPGDESSGSKPTARSVTSPLGRGEEANQP